MKDLLIYLVQSILCGGAFLFLYKTIIEKRASFGFSRFYLLTTAVLSLAIPAVSIPVYPAPPTILNVAPAGELNFHPVQAATGAGAETEVLTGTSFFPSAEYVFGGIYLLIMSVLAVIALAEVLKIRRIRLGASINNSYEYPVYISKKVSSPFSSARYIYMPPGLEKAETEQIIRHESSHLRHGHFRERIFISSLRTLMWMNPSMWMTLRYLKEIQEFQADSDVLAAGYDLTEYRKLILKQILGHNPDIACGLNNSLTKKRFIMMTSKKNKKRKVPLHIAATMLFTLGLLSIFSFTTKPVKPDTSLHNIAQSGDIIAETAEESQFKIIQFVLSESENVAELEARLAKYSKDREDFTYTISHREGKDILTIISDYSKSSDSNGNTESFIIDATGGVTIADLADYEKLPYIDEKTDSVINEAVQKKVNEVVRDHMDSVIASTKDIIATKTREVDLIFAEIAPPVSDKEEIAGDVISMVNDEDPLHMPAVMPKFMNGGLVEFREWATGQVKPVYKNGKIVTGMVMAEIVIKKDGKLDDIKILRSPNQLLSDEVIRVLKQSPRWTPGKKADGTNASVRFVIPVSFEAN